MHYVARKISYVIDEKLAANDTMEFGSPQKYKCLSFGETGNGNTVIQWESRCRECGEHFTCSSPADYTNGLTRNCKEHRQKKGYSIRKQRQKAAKPAPKEAVVAVTVENPPKHAPVVKKEESARAKHRKAHEAKLIAQGLRPDKVADRMEFYDNAWYSPKEKEEPGAPFYVPYISQQFYMGLISEEELRGLIAAHEALKNDII